MRAVKAEDTQPELIVRRLVHSLGFRYRLHRKDLPGKPDLVFPRLRKIIFVHGCFWHGHTCPRGGRLPLNNRSYWIEKIARNRSRDATSSDALSAAGWSVLVIWECMIRDRDALSTSVRAFLKS